MVSLEATITTGMPGIAREKRSSSRMVRRRMAIGNGRTELTWGCDRLNSTTEIAEIFRVSLRRN
jgi:hypothetical protein